mmetsp:Transcript_21821/g.56804  ORF Transcript_21821/g.56804 Transcript_21821/m.56804 type:complete len:135 (+) Transcript_21821:217-621(+)
MSETLVTHKGACHCGAVRFEVDAPAKVVAWDCNCSVCSMKRSMHMIAPASRFRLLAGEDSLTLYQFGGRQARHYFCRICGVQSYYVPRSNPDGVAVTVACIQPGTMAELDVRAFDGQNWDVSYAATGIASYSKE